MSLVEGVRRVINAGALASGNYGPGANYGMSNEGTLVYVRGAEAQSLQHTLVWVDRSGTETVVQTAPQAYDHPRVSPDGTRVAVFEGSGERDIWLWDLTRTTLTRVTFDPGGDLYPVWSPDGRRLLFSSARENNTRNLFWRAADGTGEVERLTESPNRQHATAISPDGRLLIFAENSPETGEDVRQLRKIPVVGGAPVPLTDVPVTAVSQVPSGIHWDPDDTIIYTQVGAVMRVSADGGEPEPLLEEGARRAELLPDETAVLLSTLDGQVAVQSLESDAPTILFPGQQARYLSTGHLVYVQDGALFAVPFDTGSLDVTGGPVPLVEGMQGTPPQYAVSESGTLVYVASGLTQGGTSQTLALVDRNGVVEPLAVPPNNYQQPRLSPDGTRLAVGVARADGSDIWVYDLSGDTALRRLTLDGGSRFPIWTPDGTRVTFASDRDGPESIYWRAADGSGVAERLTTAEDGRTHRPEAWSPDGRTLALRELEGPQGSGLWTLSLDDGDGPQLFYDVAENQLGAVFSPDGSWLTYGGGGQGRGQIHLQPFPATGEIRQVTLEGGAAMPVWSADGSELFYRRAGALVSVSVAMNGGVTFGVERPLPIKGLSMLAGTRNFDVTAGQRFLMVFPAEQADTGEAVRPQIVIVQNWFEELRERVPVP